MESLLAEAVAEVMVLPDLFRLEAHHKPEAMAVPVWLLLRSSINESA
jgi:hypothetical protein